jgi:hypothetical protein
MATPFVIGPEEAAKIRLALERARINPVAADELRRIAHNKQMASPLLKLEDRTPDDERRTGATENIHLPFGYRLAVTVELQPPGPCAHLSLSSESRKGRIPVPQALQMCAEACGCHDKPLAIWLEEYHAGSDTGTAINGVWLLP